MKIDESVVAAIVYIGFFTAISIACFVTQTGWPLFALFFHTKIYTTTMIIFFIAILILFLFGKNE